ncbi:MAG: hypothetical protein EA415_11115 [Sphaerobacteraceae bacterium]|nr:MAG: hypothetical protein EA415_11115 [Sphaerobacteraceae bacterium]
MDQDPRNEQRPPHQEPYNYHNYQQRQHESIDIDYERQRAAATRDYTTPAVITLILYFVCWLPGIIANVIYYLQAQKDEAMIGRAPQGKGCLLALLLVFNGLIALGVLVYCLLIVFSGAIAAV